MYTPHVGRWLSEDPAGYVDGPNRYLYVKGNPINQIDPSGMKMVDSGLQLCTGYIKGDWLWSWLPSHGYVLIGGTGFGFFEKNLNVSGDGEVRENDATVYPPTDNSGAVPAGSTYAICTPIKIDDCCIDKAKYQKSALQFIQDRTANPGSYTAGVRDCFGFQTDTVDYAYVNGGKNDDCCYLDKPPAVPAPFVPPPYPKPMWKKSPCCECE